jgi:purine nucleoside phosphorylase
MFQAKHLSNNADHLEVAAVDVAEAALADETDMAVAAVLAVTEIEATDAVAAVTDQDINLSALPVKQNTFPFRFYFF